MKNIDFINAASIKIENAITQVHEFDKNGKVISRQTVFSDTKTAASIREVPMLDILINALKEWREQRN